MKDKETTSIKSLSQTTRPYPSTQRLTSSTPRIGPKYFPPNVLPDEDDDMEQPVPSLTDPPSPISTPSPPTTPTPASRGHHEFPPPPTNLLTREVQAVPDKGTPTAAPSDEQSDLASSIHAPHNAPDDHDMDTPPSTILQRAPTAEEEAILAHLAHAGTNRAVLSHDGPNHRTTLPQFTPTPLGGFPKIHMSHSAQIFDYLDNKVLLAWFQVEHPKFMVRVLDHSGKDVSERAAVLAERIRASIAIIADFVHQDAPPVRVSPPQPIGGRAARELPTSFLVHKVSEETKNIILEQRIWSTLDITFEALPFSCLQPPEFLFCLSGFTTSNTETVLKAVSDVWTHDENRYRINDIFSMSEIVEEELVYKATRNLIRSIRVELLDFKIAGGLSVPRFNIFASSPSNNAKTWTELRGFLHILEYPTGLNGCGIAVALSPCQICHSLAHPRGLCPFPNLPLWNGPKSSSRNNSNSSSSRQAGRSKGGRPGRNN
ncbi:hypothetical protein C8R48DRAFT_677591 [Suillus tomentosus]|nr:hypothetical protein C8R48DRAFT_677591 [Suillus tomentosus]